MAAKTNYDLIMSLLLANVVCVVREAADQCPREDAPTIRSVATRVPEIELITVRHRVCGQPTQTWVFTETLY